VVEVEIDVVVMEVVIDVVTVLVPPIRTIPAPTAMIAITITTAATTTAVEIALRLPIFFPE